jgi:hypothetical protein
MAGRHRLPDIALHVERLRHHDDAVAGLAVVQRIGRAAIGEAEGVEVLAVGVPVAARTWAKNSDERMWRQRCLRFSSDQAGRTSR